MSGIYGLLCEDCGELLSVGKIADADAQGRKQDWYLTGWWAKEEQIQGPRLWPYVERFLIRHRLHTLRLVTEELLDRVDPDARLSDALLEQNYLEIEVRPEPDPIVETESASPVLVDRLRKVVERKMIEKEASDSK